MYTQECGCGALLPIDWPMGRKANDNGTRSELRLAKDLAHMHAAGWPGREIDKHAAFVARALS
jgi:hypothetical protein